MPATHIKAIAIHVAAMGRSYKEQRFCHSDRKR
jgi:hypothetical protein